MTPLDGGALVGSCSVWSPAGDASTNTLKANMATRMPTNMARDDADPAGHEPTGPDRSWCGNAAWRHDTRSGQRQAKAAACCAARVQGRRGDEGCGSEASTFGWDVALRFGVARPILDVALPILDVGVGVDFLGVRLLGVALRLGELSGNADCDPRE